MLTAEKNNLLCRVENGAPMGQLMKSYWLPACPAASVETAGGAPVRIRVAGEDLVIFRDQSGRLGALEEYCIHRGVSLALARNEDCGLRCIYHGWKFNADGEVLDLPTEPPEKRERMNLRQPAYPAVASGGLIWVYLGARERMPVFEPPPWADLPARRVVISQLEVKANWAQALEGQIDSAHSSMLHSTEIPAGKSQLTTIDDKGAHVRPSGAANPKIIAKFVPYGMRYVAIRKPTTNPETQDYMRVTVFVAPCFALIPPNTRNRLCNIAVPRDDVSTNMIFVHFSETMDLDTDVIEENLGTRPGIDYDPATGRNFRTRENNFMQDRALMARGHFSGIQGIGQQDIAMWESMGRAPIIDRAKEHLGSTDVAVAQFRRLMLEAVEDFQANGHVLRHSAPAAPFGKVRSYEGIVPLGTNWELLGMDEEELAAATAVSSAAE